MKVVIAVANENNPVHGRRMDLLKMRRGSQDHSQWLYKLETAMELTKWEDWTKESMIVHLFLESADTEMSKLATAMLAKEKVDLSDLRMQIRAIENSVWYKPKFQAKYVQQPKTWETDGVEGAGGPGVPNGGLKWCGDCKSKTHNTEACWGVCPHCGRRGHRQEFCNRRSEDIEKAKAAKRAEKKKEKRKKKKVRDKQLREAAKAAQTTNKTPISSTSSCSEVDSPVITDTRSARVNPGMAKKSIFNFDEKQMMKMHEDMEKNLDLNQILNAKSAKGGNPSPVIQGKCFKNVWTNSLHGKQ